MGFLQSYIAYWKNYINFTGRSTRSEYWYVVLWNMLIAVVYYVFMILFGVSTAFDAAAMGDGGDALGALFVGPFLIISLIFWLYSLATFIPNLSLLIRRFRDTGKSVWLVLLGLIPLVGGLIILIFVCLPSETNRSHQDTYDF
ncbi:hypothetical protein MFLO_01310 [Listeria floridensis FSL S10-1187]|uniref:DUF805 domain-containing protein n=1 Tax=Listeria floridensis FSL S10-1187 TaxID=1265817 RepID=A0ABN0RIU2_9LIST|nr:DUF805 domain-containing protein [Listeria floridensis]EUJ33824.1 hypothetical protein MFLO_01310 [Listeria floridensis FSL S10-1187]